MASKKFQVNCSVVIPVYNSAATLELLFTRIIKALSKARVSYELIFVDDGSRDNSWQILCRLRRRSATVRALRLTRNFGQHNALLCGFGHCRGRYVVTMDDDLQHFPEQIPVLLHELEKGHDLVYGVYSQRKHGWARNAQSTLAKLLIRLALPEISSHVSSFRAMQLWAARSVAQMNTPFTYVDGSLSWVVGSVGWVRVPVAERADGHSGYNLAKLLRYTLNILTTFSNLPLRASALLGSATAFLGMIFGVVVVWRRLLYDNISPGYTSVMAAVLFMGGLILMAQGVNGEYIGRINQKTSARPKFTERES